MELLLLCAYAFNALIFAIANRPLAMFLHMYAPLGVLLILSAIARQGKARHLLLAIFIDRSNFYLDFPGILCDLVIKESISSCSSAEECPKAPAIGEGLHGEVLDILQRMP
jgi:hypothetical protein